MAEKSFWSSRRQIWAYLRRALWVTIAWVLISNVMFFYEYSILASNRVLTTEYDFLSNFIANLIISTSAGIIGGLLTIHLMERALRRFSFINAFLIILMIYTITAFLVSAAGNIYLQGQNLDLPIYDEDVLEETFFFFSSWMFVKNYLIWLFIVLVTLIIMMVNDRFGPGVFPDYLLGKYFRPKQERRIFMFADIRNATGIAEQLGEARYFNFLKDFFRDIAPAVVRTYGEVYQYVGDEVVLSWKMKRGLKNSNALLCYYLMKELISNKAEKYEAKYGLVPEFKVGYHCGNVMSGELGQIKREIAFSGDVLNTAARIQSSCNSLGVDILASEDFAQLLVKLPEGISEKNLGAHPLKGKSESLTLVTFTEQ
ncbi:adenylate/guanylate cyclase domain-containing protein [Gilvibacter sp.]|uniref:adenylate/guanylate cyclase domain-containing protein n=1 Tax=Gilvibacter sp. TaxID=2729997 RepID=UPI0025C5B669|nr:adenylate/guanylate cyclase domain-containing protein [Gilvibacter sp.]NQX78260.1 adenylate/guanylate cyclase domain-containing protein [Gilvibacter sp.]